MKALASQAFWKTVRRPVATAVTINLLLSPALSSAGAQIPGFYSGRLVAPPANTLPSPVVTSGDGFSIAAATANSLVINQSKSNVVIDWKSFDIGSAAGVTFSQKNDSGVAQTTWSALNRIYDLNPSQIFGTLKADGNVYLLNQNGFLFGPGSSVNVGGMIASSLNLRPADFAANILNFRSEDLDGNPLGQAAQSSTVSNFGSLATGDGGFIYLIGSNVENGGSIMAPYGVVGLVAAQPMTGAGGADAPDYTLKIGQTVSYNKYQSGGTATNFATGSLISDMGKVGMYGAFVNQNGLVRATTAVKRNGVIELLASDTVTTGPGSVTESPISDSTDTADQTFVFSGGRITLAGLNRDALSQDGSFVTTGSAASIIDHQGTIYAPAAGGAGSSSTNGGMVYLEAKDRIFLDSNSVIDVSGIWSDSSASATTATAQLNSVNLRDNTAQQNGVLQGTSVTVSTTSGSSIGDVSGSLTSSSATAQQKSNSGGKIVIGIDDTGTGSEVTREIIVKTGAVIDFQGGGVNYLGGFLNSTKLLSGNTVYDISSAPQSLTYDKVLDSQSVSYGNSGVTRTYSGLYLGGGNSLGNYASSYAQGGDAGQLALHGRQVVLDGSLNGSYDRGILQNKTGDLYNTLGQLNGVGVAEPAGGYLIIGSGNKQVLVDGTRLYNDQETDNVVFSAQAAPLAGSFSLSDPLPSSLQGNTVISTGVLNRAGLSNIAVYANGSITVAQGASLELSPFTRVLTSGSTSSTVTAGFSATARVIDIFGSLSVPAGSISLTLADNITSDPATPTSYQPLNHAILLADGSSLSVAGQRVDALQQGGTALAHTGGGSVSLSDTTLQGGEVTVAPEARIDLSGGYLVDAKGSVTGGNAGSLSVNALALSLDGEIDGMSLSGYNGGAVAIRTDTVSVTRGSVPAAGNDGTTLYLADDRFAATGISQISLSSYNDLTLQAGASLTPSTLKYLAPTPATTGGASSALQNAVGGTQSGGVVDLAPELAGKSSVTLVAGAGRPGASRETARSTSPTTAPPSPSQPGPGCRAFRGGPCPSPGRRSSSRVRWSPRGGPWRSRPPPAT